MCFQLPKNCDKWTEIVLPSVSMNFLVLMFALCENVFLEQKKCYFFMSPQNVIMTFKLLVLSEPKLMI